MDSVIISVIICCYNSSKRIVPTLTALSNQNLKTDWEVILVDNNSSDDTVSVSTKIWSQLNNDIPFKIVTEPNQGLSFARKKGITEAKGKYLLFCDDDNWLDTDYLHYSVDIMEEDLTIGALCGFNKPQYESNPPEFVKRHRIAYACGHENLDSCYLDNKTVPWGAGLVIKADFMKKLRYLWLLSTRCRIFPCCQ